MTKEILGPGSETDQLIRRLKKQNKDKDWSLTGTYFLIDDIKYYNESEIDTLREKLIEDIIGYIETEKGYDKSLCSHMSYVIKEIINKRFGVRD